MKVIVNKKKTLIIVFLILVVFLCGNAFAALVGAPNIFFLINNVVKEETVEGEENLLSDREIVISYTNIEIAEGLKIQVNKIVLEDSKSTLYLSVEDEKNRELTYKLYDESTKVMGDIVKPTIGETPNIHVIKLDYKVEENSIIELGIYENNELLKTLKIDLGNKVIDVDGEEQVKKLSEVELKKYLGCFSMLNNDVIEKNANLIYISYQIDSLLENPIDNESGRERTMGIIDSFYSENYSTTTMNGKKVLKLGNSFAYDDEADSYRELTDGCDLKLGLCLDVEDITYKDGIYTVKYIYVSPTNYDYDSNNIENLDQYRATIKLKVNEDSEYSKFKVVELTESELLNNSEKVSINLIENKTDLNKEESSSDEKFRELLYEGNKYIQFDTEFFGLEDISKEYRYSENIKNYKDFEYDLDGDGIKEKITLEKKLENNVESSVFKYNGKEFAEYYHIPKIYIVDLNENDKNIEVVIFDAGQSDDPSYTIYSKSGNSMVSLETIPGPEFYTDKKGIVLVKDCENGVTIPEVYFQYYIIENGNLKKENINLDTIKNDNFVAPTLYFSPEYKPEFEMITFLNGEEYNKAQEEAFKNANIEALDENKVFKILDFEIVKVEDDYPHEEYKIYVELSDGRKGYIYYIQLAG